MRLSRILAVVAMIGLSAAIVKADGVDPNITISKGGGSIVTTAGGSQNNPIIVFDGSGVTDFLYEGPATNQLYIEVIPVNSPEAIAFFQTEFFSCSPGLAAACFSVSPCTPGEGSTCPTPPLPAVEFVFIGPAGSQFIQPGLDIGVSVPEPSTLVLLLGGLGSLIGFGMKRKEPIRA